MSRINCLSSRVAVVCIRASMRSFSSPGAVTRAGSSPSGTPESSAWARGRLFEVLQCIGDLVSEPARCAAAGPRLPGSVSGWFRQVTIESGDRRLGALQVYQAAPASGPCRPVPACSAQSLPVSRRLPFSAAAARVGGCPGVVVGRPSRSPSGIGWGFQLDCAAIDGVGICTVGWKSRSTAGRGGWQRWSCAAGRS